MCDYAILAAGSKMNPRWSWNGARLVRELGRGHYGTVYLAEEVSGRLVAVKGTDKSGTLAAKSKEGEESRHHYCSGAFHNEVRVLTKLGRHPHVVKMVGYNSEKELLALEYCQQGSLRRFVEANRGSYMDELLDHESGMMHPALSNMNRSGSVASASGSATAAGGGNLPMSDFLVSLHTKLEDGTSPVVLSPTSSTPCGTLRKGMGASGGGERKLLFNTRRLLGWSRQLARGLRFLHRRGVAHGDLALRNVLLARCDIIKITDFGLAKDLDGGGENERLIEKEDMGVEKEGDGSRDNLAMEFHGDSDVGRTTFRGDDEERQETRSRMSCRSCSSSHSRRSGRQRRALAVAWLAPEQFVDPDLATRETDVWSLGVTLWELFTLGGEPYGSDADGPGMEDDPAALARFLSSGGRLGDPPLAPSHIRSILRRCFSRDPADRPSAAVIFDEIAYPPIAINSYQNGNYAPLSSITAPAAGDSPQCSSSGYVPMAVNTSAAKGGGTGSLAGDSIGTCGTLALRGLDHRGEGDAGTIASQAISYWKGYKIISGAVNPGGEGESFDAN